MALREPTAEASLAEIRACSRLGIAMAAMIRIIATTISNSTNENPFVERIRPFLEFLNQHRPQNHPISSSFRANSAALPRTVVISRIFLYVNRLGDQPRRK